MIDSVTVWERVLIDLGFSTQRAEDQVRVGNLVFTSSLSLQENQVLFGREESIWFPDFPDPDPETATRGNVRKVLVGDCFGILRWLAHPSLPLGGPCFVRRCLKCPGYDTCTAESEGRCPTCGDEMRVMADQAVIRDMWNQTERSLLKAEIAAHEPKRKADPLDLDQAGGALRQNLQIALKASPRVNLWPGAAALEDLFRRYPNFHEVGELVLRELHLSRSRKDRSIRLPRLLLIGSPSCGKSSFADELAAILVGEDRTHLDMGHQIPHFVLVGSDASFKAAKPGRILQLLAGAQTKGHVRNPLLILDEIDKISQRSEWNPLPALLSLLDERESKTFTDEFLAAPIDASGLLVIGIANDEALLPAPLRSRFHEFYIDDYTQEQLVDVVVPQVYRQWRSEFWEGTFPEELSRETRHQIVTRSDGLPRRFSQTIADLAATGYRELFTRPTFESIAKEYQK